MEQEEPCCWLVWSINYQAFTGYVQRRQVTQRAKAPAPKPSGHNTTSQSCEQSAHTSSQKPQANTNHEAKASRAKCSMIEEGWGALEPVPRARRKWAVKRADAEVNEPALAGDPSHVFEPEVESAKNELKAGIMPEALAPLQ